MPKAFVFNDLLSPADRIRVEELLNRSGFAPVFGAGVAVSSIDLATDIGLVCLPVDKAEESTVNRRVAEFTTAGARVVAIWLDEDAEDLLPAGIEGLGSAAIAISSPRAEEALAGEAIWETTKGKARRQRPLKRNC